MSYDRLAPTISSKAKNCLVPVTWVKIIGGRCPIQMDWTPDLVNPRSAPVPLTYNFIRGE